MCPHFQIVGLSLRVLLLKHHYPLNVVQVVYRRIFIIFGDLFNTKCHFEGKVFISKVYLIVYFSPILYEVGWDYGSRSRRKEVKFDAREAKYQEHKQKWEGAPYRGSYPVLAFQVELWQVDAKKVVSVEERADFISFFHY